MLQRNILKGAIVSILTLMAMLSMFGLLLLDPLPSVAQTTDCNAGGAGMELKYDDGIPFGRMSDQSIFCTPCYRYQGVLFSLPQGLSAAQLERVRVYMSGSGSVSVHIFSVNWEYLTTPIEYKVPSGEGWNEVQVGNITVPNQFWVMIELGDTKGHVMPFYDFRMSGQSVIGESRGDVNVDPTKQPRGDFMIRAVIVPQAQVGLGQDYKTIQEAVDSVWDGWTILVHDGTYSENVTVDKSVTIKSLSGPTKTIVQTSPPYSDNNVFRITASCVRLSGFTIQSATSAGRAGVRIEDASGCVVSGNVIQDNSYGVYVSENSTNNILLENECKFNSTGIFIDGAENYISGNKLHGNTASLGSAVLLSSIASGNQLRFNSVTVDPGIDPIVAAGPQVYNQNSNEQVSAVENWWGTDTGPSNAGGQGPAVGEMVLYDPWLTKQPLRVHTVATSDGDFTMDAAAVTSTVVLKQGAGTPIVSTARFGENPLGKFPGKPIGEWVDVLFKSTDDIDQVEIRQYYTTDEIAGLKEGALRLFWWNGEKWKKCSKTGVDKKGDFVWAKLNLKTKPTSSDLTGTMFAVGTPKGGFAWWLIPLIIVAVIIALVAIRLFWVLVFGRGRYAVD